MAPHAPPSAVAGPRTSTGGYYARLKIVGKLAAALEVEPAQLAETTDGHSKPVD